MIDYVLAILLIVVMPARALYKSRRGARPDADRVKRYLLSSAIIVGLLGLLCYAWVHAARAATLLGLDMPLSPRGIVGFVIAAVIIAALAFVTVFKKRKNQGSKSEAAKLRLEGNESLPRNRRELCLFLLFALLAGCGWELLYRGFLIWFLVPHTGTIGAICIAALAYAAAHGYKNRTQFIASIVSAFAFTIAFVLTASLWWLMLIHTLIGFVGGFAGYKRASAGVENPSLAGAVGESQEVAA
ncbi:MAG: CPBP family intramembrane metalloprotease [Proteobacteria bacterium]|nr:CPBP family intramembrane metalloprotease [Pseudomonadota bacterium]